MCFNLEARRQLGPSSVGKDEDGEVLDACQSDDMLSASLGVGGDPVAGILLDLRDTVHFSAF